jgi:hypothetical protein
MVLLFLLGVAIKIEFIGIYCGISAGIFLFGLQLTKLKFSNKGNIEQI